MLALRDLKELLSAGRSGPCVSIYLPTHRHHPDNQQDPIRFRNLVRQAADSLQHDRPAALSASVLARFHALGEETEFWNHTTDGLAVFGAPDLFRIVRLQRSVPELAIVAGSFHVKPLLRIVQSADRFQVLCVNRRDIRLFEGSRDALDEIDLAEGVPRTATDVLGDELPEPSSQARSYGTGPAASGAGSNRGAGGAKSGGMHHGHGSKQDVIDQQTERFFRAVDRAVTEHHSQPSGLPLILAALPEHHAPFRSVSHNAQLIAPGLEVNPEALSIDELRTRAWQVMEPVYLERLAGLVERFGAARTSQLGDDRLPQVAAAAAAGRVGTLLIDAQRHVPGRLDPATGSTRTGTLAHPEVDDMLDDLAELVLAKGGEIVIVPADRMPSATGLAAIYRY
ncbi:hypothetical protein BURK1_00566 [Burkholderiales bacterium]|nr:hypothetical protein BURK1_00566 [Burkholderiales bacterium]